LKIIKAELPEVAAFLYTSDEGNKHLVVEKSLSKSKIETIEREAESKESFLWKE